MYGLRDLTLNVNDPSFGVIGNPNAVPPASAGMATPPMTQAEDQYAALLAAGNPACTCVAGTCAETGDSCSSAPSPTTDSSMAWILGAFGLLVFGMVAMGGGSARRYGR